MSTVRTMCKSIGNWRLPCTVCLQTLVPSWVLLASSMQPDLCKHDNQLCKSKNPCGFCGDSLAVCLCVSACAAGAHLDIHPHSMSNLQHTVPKEKVAQRTVSNSCATVCQDAQFRVGQACAMSHDGPAPQQACFVQQSSVAARLSWVQGLGVLHLQCTTAC